MKGDRLKHHAYSSRTWLIGLCVIIAAIAIALTGRIVTSVLDHKEKYQYLAQALDPQSQQPSLIDWSTDIQTKGRTLTKSDQEIIGKRITKAWYNFILANQSGNSAFVKDYFDGSALQNASSFIERVERSEEKGLVIIDQNPQARFFHADGSTLEIKSDNSITLRYSIDKAEDNIQLMALAKECTRNLLVLYSIGWKIRNHETDCYEPITDRSSIEKRRPHQLPIKGINYYPSKTPWADFWPSFDLKIIADDLALISDLGATSIRIFLPFDYFSAPATKKDALMRLDQFLDLSNKQGISIVPTLFDFRSAYDAKGYAAEFSYLKDVMEVLRRHENVWLVDLKNEPDLDYQHVGKARVDMWLTVFSNLISHLAPELNVTIGWLSYENAAEKADLVDLVSYHEYEDPKDAANSYAIVKAASNGKPVVITELGKPSWSLAGGYPFTQQSQAQWLGQQLKALSASDGVMIWTLHDFTFEAAGKVANLPWRKAMQASYGVYDLGGKPKLAADVFRQFQLTKTDK